MQIKYRLNRWWEWCWVFCKKWITHNWSVRDTKIRTLRLRRAWKITISWKEKSSLSSMRLRKNGYRRLHGRIRNSNNNKSLSTCQRFLSRFRSIRIDRTKLITTRSGFGKRFNVRDGHNCRQNIRIVVAWFFNTTKHLKSILNEKGLY